MRIRNLILPSVLLVVVSALAGSAWADTITNIEQFVSTGAKPVTIDGFDSSSLNQGPLPVISDILSQPGTVNSLYYGSKTYSSWAFLANDTTGSVEVYGKMPTGSTYTPTVGDAITATGTWSPYNQIPELETLTAITQSSPGNTVPPPNPMVTTVSAVNVSPMPFSLAGHYLELQDVTISGFTDRDPVKGFGSNNSPSGGTTITDSSNNSMVLYYWPSSYSAAFSNLGSVQIPSATTPVNVYGIADVYSGGASPLAEFIPMNITNVDGSPLATAVPEPGTLALLGAGLAMAAAAFIRRRKPAK